MALWDSTAGETIQKQVARLRNQAHAELKRSYDLAVDYLENRQRQDIEAELLDRFPSTQVGDSGQMIYPITLPLTRRFVEEAASAYDRTVKRKLTLDDGTENEATKKATDALNRHLDEILYDETMHRNEQLTVLLGSSVVWYQQRADKLEPQIVLPQNTYPIAPADGLNINPANQDDYEAFVFELFWASDDISKAQKRSFAFVSQKETVFFYGAPDKVEDFIGPRYPNTIGMSPVTVWHKTHPLGQLLPLSDVPIVDINRELNLMWSLLLDTLRLQGYDIPVKTLSNPRDPAARQRHGARHPVVLAMGETFDYLHSNANYGQICDVLVRLQKLVALLERMSPNDFAIDGVAPSSGFAKMIDSLPKIEARSARLRRLRYHETRIAWPRIGAILTNLGVLPAGAKELRLNVEFADIVFPRTPDEEAAADEHDIKYNLTTPAHMYAKRHNVSVEEAKQAIEANAEMNAELRSKGPQPEQPPPPPGAQIGGLIGRRTRNPTADNGTSRRDRFSRGVGDEGEGERR